MGRWLRLLRSDILSMFDDLDAIRSHWWIEKNLALVLVVTAGIAVVSHVAHTPLPGFTLNC